MKDNHSKDKENQRRLQAAVLLPLKRSYMQLLLMNVTVHVVVKIAVGLLGSVWVTITVTVSNSTYMYLYRFYIKGSSSIVVSLAPLFHVFKCDTNSHLPRYIERLLFFKTCYLCSRGSGLFWPT